MRRKGECGVYLVLTDFHLAGQISNELKQRTGTPGWVCDGSPFRCSQDIDLIAFGTVLGWLLRIRECGDPGADYESIWIRCLGFVRLVHNGVAVCSW